MSAPALMTHPIAAWYADQVIANAAARIERYAEDLRMCHQVDGQWQGEHEACEAYETDLHTVRELQGLLVALRGPCAQPPSEPDRGDDGRGLFERAIEVTRQDNGASSRSLQRALGVDEAAAAQLLDQLSRAGVTEPANESGYQEARAA